MILSRLLRVASIVVLAVLFYFSTKEPSEAAIPAPRTNPNANLEHGLPGKDSETGSVTSANAPMSMEVLPYSASHVRVTLLGSHPQPVNVDVQTELENKILHQGLSLEGKATLVVPYFRSALYRITTEEGTLLATANSVASPDMQDWSKMALILMVITGSLFFFTKRRTLFA